MSLFDIFKPGWKHSNPSVRAAAIASLGEEDKDRLLSIALNDSEPGNRRAAVRRINNAQALKSLLSGGADSTVREEARKNLNAVRAAELKSLPTDGEQTRARCWEGLEEISDQKVLMDVAKAALAPEVRRAAYTRLTHASAFHSLAMEEADGELALIALEKIVKQNQLEALARGAKSKAARSAAKEKLKALTVASEESKAGAIAKAKLAILLQSVERASQSSDWEKSKDLMDRADSDLRELQEAGAHPSESEAAAIAAWREQFYIRYNNHQAEIDHKRESEKREIENTEAKSDLCLQAEALLSVSASPEASEKAADLKRRWRELGAASPGREAELREKFRRSMEKLEAEHDTIRREREALEKRQANEDGLKSQIEGLLLEVESLSEGREPGPYGERLRNLSQAWDKAYGPEAPWPGAETLPERFETAKAKASALAKERSKATLEKLQELIPQLESLLDLPDMARAEKRFKELCAAWKSAGAVEDDGDTELQDRYRILYDRFRETQDWLRWSNLRIKQVICDKLEALAAVEDVRTVPPQFRELQMEWKAVGPVPWDSSEALWDRYRQSCDKIYEKCRGFFAELDEERESNLKAKEELCARIEALENNTDWKESTEIIKEAQSAWKEMGAVPREQSDAVWNRFRSACNAFFDKRDERNRENLYGKVELCELAEALRDSTDWKGTAPRIREIQEKWKSIGPVPRDQAEAIWQRFHSACEHFFNARKAFLEKLESDRPLNQAKKEDLCRLVESLDELEAEGDDTKMLRIKEAQAAWKLIGPAPREAEDKLWERFRKPCDAFFEVRRQQYEHEKGTRLESQKLKEDICAEAESLSQSTEWKETVAKIKVLQERWKAAGTAPRAFERELWKRYRAACDIFFSRLRENSEERDRLRNGNLKAKEDLCFQVEMLCHRDLTQEEARQRMDWQLEKLSENFGKHQIRDAGPEGMDWMAAMEKVKSLQKDWKKIGPVPREKSDALWERFHKACDDFFAERRQALGLKEENPQANLEEKLELCHQAEELGSMEATPATTERTGERIRGLQRQWRKIGPVPRAQADTIWNRFQEACAKVLESGRNGSEAFPNGESPVEIQNPE